MPILLFFRKKIKARNISIHLSNYNLYIITSMGVSIFNTRFTYLRNSFNHDHIKKKSLKGTFSFYLFELFK